MRLEWMGSAVCPLATGERDASFALMSLRVHLLFFL